ncbi:MAG TPA: hypothetical protein PK659_08685 [Methanothrix sp.]|nr:hypothetical protein [Methanothrix sp.]HOL44312.1 hypothetical protein [Methanothrix sp.]
MKRIIRSIRIDPEIWEAARNAVREEKTYVSRVIESLLLGYLKRRRLSAYSTAAEPHQETKLNSTML